MSVRLNNGTGRLYGADGRQLVAAVTYQIWRKSATECAEERWWGRFTLGHTIDEQGEYVVELEDGRKGACLIEVNHEARWVPGLLAVYRYNLKGIGTLT